MDTEDHRADPPEDRPPHGPVAEQPPFRVDGAAMGVLDRLWSAGQAAYLVGGAVRDALLGRESHDWDVATDALPERILELFPQGSYGNRFGTVIADGVEITTFRREHRYADHRRPEQVTFSRDLHEDLARRDFSVNAIAWGRAAEPGSRAGYEDPIGGRADLRARLLRAVGEPGLRFEEDALRLLRAARIASESSLTLDPATRAAMVEHAADVRWVSAERVGSEIGRMLLADVPSVGFRLLEETGIIELVLPEVSAQRSIPQAKIPGHDLFDHSMATLDAAARAHPGRTTLLWAALLHDIGKPACMRDGRFLGHDEVGARMARVLMERLKCPSRDAVRVARLVGAHMFHYESRWSDAAVRRFMRRVGIDLIDDLLALREADDEGSGRDHIRSIDELRTRIQEQLSRGVVLGLGDLAVDGHDLQHELGLPPGPRIGWLLERLLDAVIADPRRNRRADLLARARELVVRDPSQPGIG